MLFTPFISILQNETCNFDNVVWASVFLNLYKFQFEQGDQGSPISLGLLKS